MEKNRKSRLHSNNKPMQTQSSTYRTNGKTVLDLPLGKNIKSELLEEIVRALKSVSGYGSIEIYVQDHSVTQITIRSIRKTKHVLAE